MTSAPLRVVHVVLSLDTGGLERVVLDLVRRADPQRVEPSVLCLRGPGQLAPLFGAAGIRVEALHTRRGWDAVVTLARRLRQLRPDVVHTHNPGPHLVGAVAARLAGIPVVVHTRHGRTYSHVPRAALFSRLASPLTDVIVAVSEEAAAVACDVEGVSRQRVRVLYNGIDLSVFHPPGASPRRFSARAIHVARLDPVKDQGTLLRAARIVADVRKDFELLFVGDGPERPRLESLLAELELAPHVRLLGTRDDVPALLGESDIFVLSSLSEGFSLAVIEAMAAGLAVVATDVGGNREAVEDGETGRLVPPRSPERLAGALLGLLDDVEGARRMGAAGRRRVEARFDLSHTVAEYERLYRELFARHAGRAA